MKRYTTLAMILAVFMTMTSCSKSLTPFTKEVYDEYGFSTEELKGIQFYLSRDIVLQREVSKSESKVTEGKIRLVNGRKVEEVVFKKGTPGVCVLEPKTERLAISFEAEDHKFLMFGPNQKMNNRFVLLGKKWNRGLGKVTYDGKVYDTTSESAYSSLLVDLRHATRELRKSETAEGRRVGRR